MSSSSVARASAVFGVLAIAAIPAGAAIPTFVDTIGVLRAGLIAVPVGLLARADRDLARPAGEVQARPERPAPWRADRPLCPLPRLGGPLPGGHGRARARLLRPAPAALELVAPGRRRTRHGGPNGGAVVRSWRRVRDREQPPRSPVAAQGRVRPGRAGNEDPGQVPARARGRALRPAAVGDLRQGLPAHLRRLPRPRRPAVRRRVQLPLRRRGRPRVAAAPLLLARRAPQAEPRDERRAARARDHLADHDHRDQRLEDVRQRHEGAGRDPRQGRAQARSPSTIPTSRSRPSAAPRTSPSTGAARRARSCSRAPSNRGKTEPFTGKWFWLNVSSPENLSITVRGKAVPLPGNRPLALTITPSGVHTD